METLADDARRLEARIAHTRRSRAGDGVHRARALRVLELELGNQTVSRRRVGICIAHRSPRLCLQRANLRHRRVAAGVETLELRLGISLAEVVAHHAHHILRLDRVERRILVRRNTREIRGKLEVLLLPQRVALVIVATAAAHAYAEKCARGGVDHRVHVVGQRLREIRNFVVPQAEPEEARRDEGVEVAVGQLVARNMGANEARVRHVVVQRAHHKVAVLPRGLFVAVALEAVGVGVAHEVEPVARPFLAIVGTREQTIDEAFVSIGRWILHERVDLFGRGRKASQVVGRAADERFAGRLRRGMKSGARSCSLAGSLAGSLAASLDWGQDEPIDVVAAPRAVTNRRRGRLDQLLIRVPRVARGGRLLNEELVSGQFLGGQLLDGRLLELLTDRGRDVRRAREQCGQQCGE